MFSYTAWALLSEQPRKARLIFYNNFDYVEERRWCWSVLKWDIRHHRRQQHKPFVVEEVSTTVLQWWTRILAVTMMMLVLNCLSFSTTALQCIARRLLQWCTRILAVTINDQQWWFSYWSQTSYGAAAALCRRRRPINYFSFSRTLLQWYLVLAVTMLLMMMTKAQQRQ